MGEERKRNLRGRMKKERVKGEGEEWRLSVRGDGRKG